MILTASINEVTRKITFDNPHAVVAVVGDYEVNGVAFAFPSIYEDDFNLSEAVKTVYYEATDGNIYNHIVTDTDTDTGYPLWVFTDEINKGEYGDVDFALVCDKVENGTIVKRWVSLITVFRVQRSIPIDEAAQEDNEQTYSERLAYLMTQVANMQTSVTTASESASAALTKANAVDERLNNIIIESGTSEAEVVAARTNSDTGRTYSTLGTRLDTEYSGIKEDLFAYNAADILAPIATYTNRTLNGITYTWDITNKSCTATGMPTGNTYTNVIASQNSLPAGIEAGKHYYVTFKTTNQNFVLYFLFYGNGSTLGNVSVTNNTYITIPVDCTGIVIRLRVMANINGEATASNIAILTAEPNSVLADKIAVNASFSTDFLKNYQGSNSTINGVSFNWQGGTCTVSGTANARADYNIIDSQQSLLDNMQVGDSFIFACDKTDTKIISQVVFYDSNGAVITRKTGTSIDVPFVIPVGTVGIKVRFYVDNGATVNGSVSNIKLVKLNNKKMSVPLIVSFVDDDTTSDTLVTKYHDACCHNGIKGSYAVITKRLEDGNTQASRLLSYEDEGFGMCIHCYQQSGVAEWNATVRTDAVANTCRANLAKGLRQMRGHGFLNYAHWITPGGHAEPDLKETAKMLGCKCLITTNNGRANLMQDINPWHIKRISLRYDDNGTSENSLAGVKNIIDKTVSEGSGWLIITTHFNEGWGDLTWDTTLDNNGYPIGYSRFNEIVQYAINSGLVPMTIQQAWAYYEDILTANIEECNMANA